MSAVMGSGRFIAAVCTVSRRCFSAMSGPSFTSSEQAGRRVAAAVAKKEGGDASPSWVPDPVTGYYKPGNMAEDVDVAELRRALLNHKH